MLSGRGRIPTAAALAAPLVALSMLATPAHANPATGGLSMPAGAGWRWCPVGRFQLGRQSITVQFPDGKSIHMPGRTKRFYLYYAGRTRQAVGHRTKNHQPRDHGPADAPMRGEVALNCRRVAS